MYYHGKTSVLETFEVGTLRESFFVISHWLIVKDTKLKSLVQDLHEHTLWLEKWMLYNWEWFMALCFAEIIPSLERYRKLN